MNKLRYNVSFWLGALFLFVTGGCSDYFDVRPKSQVLADELFSTEEGFSDQLTGVYKRLASTSLYGQEMTFGLAEALTQNYDLATGSEYYEAGLYNYENTAVKNKITTVWSQMYSAIANLNIMLEYIDKIIIAYTKGRLWDCVLFCIWIYCGCSLLRMLRMHKLQPSLM